MAAGKRARAGRCGYCRAAPYELGNGGKTGQVICSARRIILPQGCRSIRRSDARRQNAELRCISPQAPRFRWYSRWLAARGIPIGIETNPWNLIRLKPAKGARYARPPALPHGAPDDVRVRHRVSQFAQDLRRRPPGRAACRCARSRSSGGEPPLRVYDTSGPQGHDVTRRPAEAARAVGRARAARRRRRA